MANAAVKWEPNELTPDQWVLVVENADLLWPLYCRSGLNRGWWVSRKDDFLSAGQWALIVAAAKWRSDGGCNFRWYASVGILREMGDEVRRIVRMWRIEYGEHLDLNQVPDPDTVGKRTAVDGHAGVVAAARAAVSVREWEWLAATAGVGREVETGAAVAARTGYTRAMVSHVVRAARAKLKTALA